jgi:hypothetical protein
LPFHTVNALPWYLYRNATPTYVTRPGQPMKMTLVGLFDLCTEYSSNSHALTTKICETLSYIFNRIRPLRQLCQRGARAEARLVRFASRWHLLHIANKNPWLFCTYM